MVHTNPRVAYKCPLCNRVYTTLSSLFTHLSWSHAPTEPRCTCCNKTFASMNALIQHVAKKALDDVCHAALYIALRIGVSGNSATREHRKRVAKYLRDETRIELSNGNSNDVTMFKCPWCDFVTYSMSSLSRHVAVYHRDEGVCPACCTRFTSRRGIVRHAVDLARSGDDAHAYVAYLLSSNHRVRTELRERALRYALSNGNVHVSRCIRIVDRDYHRYAPTHQTTCVKVTEHSAMGELIKRVGSSAVVLRAGVALLAALTGVVEPGRDDKDALKRAVYALTGRDVNVDELLNEISRILYHNARRD